MNASASSKRRKAGLLILAAFAMVFAGLGATCDALCCPLAPPQASVHAMMPCCAGTASMSRPGAVRVPVATATAQVQTPAPSPVVALLTVADAAPLRLQLVAAASPSAHHHPSPPLFLRNAQLLI